MARQRNKRHIPERMEVCHERWFDAPVLNKGNWRAACSFPEDAEVYLEIGCGKGKFCTETAMANPGVLYIALERDSSVILSAIEKAHALEIPNLFFVNADAQMLENFFDTDEIDRIYINFCDPWTRRRKPKRRLTYRDFLTKYKTMLKKGGQIRFKTDNDELFEFSVGEFTDCGWALSEITRDLHNSEWDADNIRTEFEQKFADQGIPIKRLVATSNS